MKYISKLSKITNIKRESKIKIEIIKFNNAIQFYVRNLKMKIFYFLFNNYELNIKLGNFFIKTMINKTKKIYRKMLLNKLKNNHQYLIRKEAIIRSKLKSIEKRLYEKLFLKSLKTNNDDLKMQRLKDEMIEKLKNKAKLLLDEGSFK